MLPKNSQNRSDQDGEFDDWNKLFNPADVDQDISGFYLSDSKKQPDKWKFPEGTIISKMGYLIVWCDEDLYKLDYIPITNSPQMEKMLFLPTPV